MKYWTILNVEYGISVLPDTIVTTLLAELIYSYFGSALGLGDRCGSIKVLLYSFELRRDALQWL